MSPFEQVKHLLPKLTPYERGALIEILAPDDDNEGEVASDGGCLLPLDDLPLITDFELPTFDLPLSTETICPACRQSVSKP